MNFEKSSLETSKSETGLLREEIDKMQAELKAMVMAGNTDAPEYGWLGERLAEKKRQLKTLEDSSLDDLTEKVLEVGSAGSSGSIIKGGPLEKTLDITEAKFLSAKDQPNEDKLDRAA